MAGESPNARFDERFAGRLRACVQALERLLDRPGFGTGPATVGAELELDLADAEGHPFRGNREVRDAVDDPRVTLELGRFNLEVNSTPQPLAGRPFTALVDELREVLTAIDAAAAERGCRIALVGILPTLQEADLQGDALTESARYRALNAGLQRLRREPFRIAISGLDELEVACDDVSLEAANTSFQLHLRVDPSDFAAVYNAAQLATVPALAVSGNSPLLLERLLWEETRIALFQQSVDHRAGPDEGRRFARVAFGTGWLHDGALRLFDESVALHEPLIPELSEEDPLAVVESGGTPQLAELRLHQGTIWRWNRAIFDPAGGGHLRVELRALPSGPTLQDMMANAAFLLGSTLALAPRMQAHTEALTFSEVHRSFYRAAREGLAAEIAWPDGDGGAATAGAADVVLDLLPDAAAALAAAGVAMEEVDRLLGLVRARAVARQTGASWQRRTLQAVEQRRGRSEGTRVMLARYLDHSRGGEPVATWEL